MTRRKTQRTSGTGHQSVCAATGHVILIVIRPWRIDTFSPPEDGWRRRGREIPGVHPAWGYFVRLALTRRDVVPSQIATPAIAAPAAS
jgi:hypothetical protein